MLSKRMYYALSSVGGESRIQYNDGDDCHKGSYPWDLSLYFGYCKSRKEHDAIFGKLYDTEKAAKVVIDKLKKKANTISTFMIDADMVEFVGPCIRKVRAMTLHKNGFAIYFRYANDEKTYYQKLTCNHDYYTAYGDDTEFEIVTSFVDSGVPQTGMPAYEYALAHFMENSLVKKGQIANAELLKKENLRRIEILSAIKNLDKEFTLPDYYDSQYVVNRESQAHYGDPYFNKTTWRTCYGFFYGRVTKDAWDEFVKKYPNYNNTLAPNHFDTRESNIINLKINGLCEVLHKVPGAGAFGVTEHNTHAIYANDYFEEWTIEYELGMDIVDAMSIKYINEPLVEVDLSVHDDADWIHSVIVRTEYGKQYLGDGAFHPNK